MFIVFIPVVTFLQLTTDSYFTWSAFRLLACTPISNSTYICYVRPLFTLNLFLFLYIYTCVYISFSSAASVLARCNFPIVINSNMQWLSHCIFWTVWLFWPTLNCLKISCLILIGTCISIIIIIRLLPGHLGPLPGILWFCFFLPSLFIILPFPSNCISIIIWYIVVMEEVRPTSLIMYLLKIENVSCLWVRKYCLS